MAKFSMDRRRGALSGVFLRHGPQGDALETARTAGPIQAAALLSER